MNSMRMNCVLLAVVPFLAVAAHADEGLSPSRVAGEVAFDTSMTPAEIMTELAEEALAIDPNAQVEFVVTIPTISDGNVKSDNLSGLPVDDRGADGVYNRRGEKIREMSVSIPFSANDYIVDGHLDSAKMHYETGDILTRLATTGSVQSKNDMRTQNALNYANCGGFPVGTQITDTTNNCFGTTTSTYQCIATGDGQKDWILMSQEFYPAEAACIGS